MILRVLCLSCLAVAAGTAAVDRIQMIPGARQTASAPDGTLFALGAGSVQTTPGAWIPVNSKVNAASSYLVHLDASGEVLYATYLNFSPAGLSVDARGAVVLAGTTTDPDYPVTAGAYNGAVKGGEQFVVARLNPSGSALEFAATLGGSASPYGGCGAWSAAPAPDGTVYVTGCTYSADFPVTSDAYQRTKTGTGRTAFLARLSADGRGLLYSTYLGGFQDSQAKALHVDTSGRVYLAGTADSDDFPVTAGSYTTAIPDGQHLVSRTFVARWSATSGQFDYVAAFGYFASPVLFLRSDNTGRAVVASFNIWHSIPATAGAFRPDAESSPIVFELNETGSKLVYATGVSSEYSEIYGFGSDADGNTVVVGQTAQPGIPATIGAHALYSTSGYYVAKLDKTGGKLVYGTYFDADWLYGADVSGGTIHIGTNGMGDGIAIGQTIPVMVEPAADSANAALHALPNVVQSCASGLDYPLPALVWNIRDGAVESAEVHASRPDGPLVGTGLSGSVSVDQPRTVYFLQNTTGGRPLTSGNTLAIETFTFGPAVRCSAVPKPTGTLRATPNPVLACRENELTGTVTRLTASPGEIHVLTPDGTLFASGPQGIQADTGDWVRNGMDFFLTYQGTAVAAERVFLLPVRDCTTGTATPAAMRANPAHLECLPGVRSTLAWYSASYSVVEIRQDSPSGATLGRFIGPHGLFDVAPTTSHTYWLVGYQDGAWTALASEPISGGALSCFPGR